MKGTDVIVTNYRTLEDLRRFLESIDESGPISVYVCDVDPIPVEEKYAKALAEDHGATYVPFQSNVGYAVASNMAASMGTRECLAIFNADVVLSPDAITQCSQALLDNPEWGALGPLQVNSAGLTTHCGIFGELKAPQWRMIGGLADSRHEDIRDDAVTIVGAAYFVRRKVWEEMAACPVFLEHFPEARGAFGTTQFYYEETILSYHLQGHGYKICYYGPVEIRHEWHGSVKRNGVEEWAAQQFITSRDQFRAFCQSHNIDHD